MSDVVLVDVTDRVATVTLNRPKVRNAINGELGLALAQAVGAADARDDVDVLILTGVDPAFCAGADLTEVAGAAARTPAPSDPDDPWRRDEVGRFTFRGPFPPRTKLLVGAINGPAITGGLELALNCDLLVASEEARFADTHARVGVMPGWGLTVLLAEAVGLRRARAARARPAPSSPPSRRWPGASSTTLLSMTDSCRSPASWRKLRRTTTKLPSGGCFRPTLRSQRRFMTPGGKSRIESIGNGGPRHLTELS